MFRLSLFKIRAFTFGNIAGLLGALGRGGIQFMLIIWLQGIWLPQHGFSFSQTPLWAGIAMIPLTIGFLIVGPIAGWMSDRHGARLFATTGLVVSARQLPAAGDAADQLQLRLVRGADLPVRGRHGAVLLAQPGQRHEQPAARAARRRRGHAQHVPELGDRAVDGPVLHDRHARARVPAALSACTRAWSRRASARRRPRTVANEPPIGSLFSAFLGYNPIQELLGPTGALQHLPAKQVAYITGRSFFPKLIEQPFAGGLHLAFTFAAIATIIAIVASALRGKRYVHAVSAPVEAEAPVDAVMGEMVQPARRRRAGRRPGSHSVRASSR